MNFKYLSSCGLPVGLVVVWCPRSLIHDWLTETCFQHLPFFFPLSLFMFEVTVIYATHVKLVVRLRGLN